MSIGVYVHVPFCRTRCHFCAFYLQIYREHNALAYVKVLAHEIRLHAAQDSLEGRPLDSIYFGGGTPTVLRPVELSRILRLIVDQFDLASHAELTLEAHPDTVTAEGLDVLVRAGFNRVSFGVQSMEREELLLVGRPTSPDKTRSAVSLARAAGFDNISLDLIYGLPGQTLASWRMTLDETMALSPSHISCYALAVEDGTRLQRDFQRRESPEADGELQLAMEHETAYKLGAAGFQHYEISNFCKPGFACRHNLLYWTGGDYLGLGPSAQSYVKGWRFGNVEDLEEYQKALNTGQMPIVRRERLSGEQRRREAVVFGLRLTGGIDLTAQGYDTCVTDHGWNKELERLIGQGLVERLADRITLTEIGRRFADSVAVALL
ncbi:MAG: radical SAM family heme chaperone HemW [Nitrospiraceae bacterium]